MGGRQLVAAFVIVVVLCGVFFTLGYVMGQTAQGSLSLLTFKNHKSPPAAASSDEGKTAGNTPAAPNLDFYSLRDPGRTATELPAPAPKSASAPAPSPARPALALRDPAMARGALVLQVAALRHEADALALANLLQQKDYPAFVLPNKTGKLFRVQVGPYKDALSAGLARRALAREGFKSILKR